MEKTPYYLINLEGIKAKLLELKIAFGKGILPCQIYYSMKTNNLPIIAQYMRHSGINVEVVSHDELIFALRDGFCPNKIIFNGPCKSTKAIIDAIKLGITIHADSLNELNLIESCVRSLNMKAKVGLRLAHTYLGNDPSLNGEKSRFGLTEDQVINFFKKTFSLINIYGFHYHTGSRILSAEPYQELINILRNIKPYLKNEFYVDIGGGFPNHYKNLTNLDDMVTLVNQINDLLAEFPVDHIKIEPGRILFEENASLTASICDIKPRKDNNIIFLDVSVNELRSMNRFEHDIFIDPLVQKSNVEQQIYNITGYNCFEGDYLAKKFKTNNILSIGDKITVSHAGAYDLMTCLNWMRQKPSLYIKYDGSLYPAKFRTYSNQHILPPKIVIDDALLLRRVSLDDIDPIYTIINYNRECFSKYMDWVKDTLNVSAVKENVIDSIHLFDEGKEYNFVISYKSTVVGRFSVRASGADANIGYWLDSRFQKLGILTKTLKYVSNILIQSNAINNIFLKCAIFNKSSNALAKRSGYHLIGTLPKNESINGTLHDQRIYVLNKSLLG